MNFLKTFIISLVIYLGLNTVFMLIAMFTVTGYPADDVWYLVCAVFAPIAIYPGAAWVEFGIAPLLVASNLTTIMYFISLIVPPFLALLVAAFIGENNLTGFGAWFLTAFLSCSLYAIFLGIGQGTSALLYLQWLGMTTSIGLVGGILDIFMAGVVNGFFYGCICILLAKKFL
ncbi:MAG: hypothetical protein KGD73_09785 [Candidatus Lokiarchaeota archaeon]|nr:hypothetical protein [Candidatus Lokiarchaeota archaeon]